MERPAPVTGRNTFERIPIWYDLPELFTEPPWSYVDWKIKDAAVFFTAVGVTYFLSSSVAFSLWAFYILNQLYRMYLGYTTNDPTDYGRDDQHFGGADRLRDFGAVDRTASLEACGASGLPRATRR